tara:strand:+ start:27465 stop:28001 length:537 start_codon:yes stop_codon:yes gene_type:complete
MNTDKLKNNKVIKELNEIFITVNNTTVKLIGGAVIDILEGRVPKDYDIIVPYNRSKVVVALMINGFDFKYTTATSETFKKGDVVVQILCSQPSDFDFTISSSQYVFNTGELTIDEISFKNKTLIPNVFNDKKAALNSLSRIPHWMAKGYTIKNETYFSLLNCLNDKVVPYVSELPHRS